MGDIRFKNGKILFVEGKIAMGPECCCADEDSSSSTPNQCPSDCTTCPGTITVTVTADGTWEADTYAMTKSGCSWTHAVASITCSGGVWFLNFFIECSADGGVYQATYTSTAYDPGCPSLDAADWTFDAIGHEFGGTSCDAAGEPTWSLS